MITKLNKKKRKNIWASETTSNDGGRGVNAVYLAAEVLSELVFVCSRYLGPCSAPRRAVYMDDPGQNFRATLPMISEIRHFCFLFLFSPPDSTRPKTSHACHAPKQQ